MPISNRWDVPIPTWFFVFLASLNIPLTHRRPHRDCCRRCWTRTRTEAGTSTRGRPQTCLRRWLWPPKEMESHRWDRSTYRWCTLWRWNLRYGVSVRVRHDQHVLRLRQLQVLRSGPAEVLHRVRPSVRAVEQAGLSGSLGTRLPKHSADDLQARAGSHDQGLPDLIL